MKKQIWGLLLIAIGVLFLLQGTEQFRFGLSFWPVVLTLIGGGVALSSLRRWPPSWFGLILGLWVGSIGLLDILYDAELTAVHGSLVARQGWPVFLIAIGLSVLFGSRFRVSGRWSRGGEYDYRVIGDMRYGQNRWRLDQDFSLDHGIGDLKIDLTTAEIAEGDHTITLKAAIGDLVVRVPDNVSVSVDARAGIGDLSVLGDHRSGMSLIVHKQLIVPESNIHLYIDAKLGIGNLRVVQSPAQQNRLVL